MVLLYIVKFERKKNDLRSFFNFMPLRVAAHKRTRRSPLVNHLDQRGHPFGYPVRMWDSRLSARTDSGFHAADRLEVTKLGADLSKAHVQ